MMRFRLLPIVFILSWTVVATVRADVHDELQGIKQEIRHKRKLLKKTDRVEKKVSSELLSIDQTLREKEANLSALGKELQTVEGTLNRTQKDIDGVRLDLEQKGQLIRVRLASLYKTGEMSNLRMFFSSGSLPQALENHRYMNAVLGQDRRFFAAYQQKLAELQHLKTSLEQDVRRKERLKTSIVEKKREIEVEKGKKSAYLSQVRNEKKGYIASIKELEANARRLQTMVERLEARRRKSYTAQSAKKHDITGRYASPPLSDKGFGALRGRLNLPASGAIIGSFGKQKHHEFNSFTVSNGITIGAPLNAEIHAVYDGQVIYADRFKGYGNLLIIDHGGGYFTLYAHAARLLKKVGVQIHRNDVVALVGDTDSPRGPELYFEIRYQGKPIDPGPWFR